MHTVSDILRIMYKGHEGVEHIISSILSICIIKRVYGLTTSVEFPRSPRHTRENAVCMHCLYGIIA